MAQHVTFFKMQVQPGRAEELAALMREDEADRERMSGKGWELSVVGTRKDNPEEIWGCVTWDTSERYYANADDPEQDAWYQKMRALLAADPEWFDCDVAAEDRA